MAVDPQPPASSVDDSTLNFRARESDSEKAAKDRDAIEKNLDLLEQAVGQEISAGESNLDSARPEADATWAPGLEETSSRGQAVTAPNDCRQKQLGNYELIEKIGEGGMGAVWKARQLRPVVRDVAIKMVHLAAATSDNLKRFEQERQTLARMRHPNISTILDGGTTSDGQPYLVMELANGIRLDEYCQSHSLTVHQRIELLAKIAKALTHAHEQNVIHRDLKPGNILVETNETGIHFKVIDFGISKLTGQDSQVDATMAGEIVGTPHYMSPEQAKVLDSAVDARSDVYSLGAILFQLATGSPPLAAAGLNLDAGIPKLFAAIRDLDPPKPSSFLRKQNNLEHLAEERSTSPRYLLRQVKGDLDWVTLKALAKEPGERYATAREFADDLERLINIQPVSAKRPTLNYRLRKFIQRRKSIVFLVTTLVLTIVLSAAGFAYNQWSVQQARLQKQQKDAEKIESLIEKGKRPFGQKQFNRLQLFQIDRGSLLSTRRCR